MRLSSWQIVNLVILLFVAAVPVPAQGRTGDNLAATTSVAAALARAGVPTQPGQIELSEPFSTAGIEEELHVTAAELLTDRRLRVHLACQKIQDCRPFLAILRPTSSQQALSDLAALQTAVQPLSPVHAAGGPTRLLAGQHVTLLLEDKHMRITVPVIAIDTGALGTEIRVSSLDRKQVFHGVVSDARTVRGALP